MARRTKNNGFSERLEGPRFLEERTVRQARRVVPLNDDSYLPIRRRHSWRLPLAFLLAGALGAGVALLGTRLRPQVDAIPEVAGEDTPATVSLDALEPNQMEAGSTSESAISASSNDSEVAPPKVPVLVTERGKGPVSAPVMATVKTQPAVSESHIDDSGNSSTPSTGRLSDNWQESRPRRVNFPRTQRRGVHQSRDLSRIDEIFEGSHP